MATRAEQKYATRQRIVSAAARLFARRGFGRTKTADIARAAGLSHGAVFVHFPTRDALVQAVAGSIGRAITDRLHELAAGGGSLRRILKAHVRAVREREDLYRHLLAELPFLPEVVRTAWAGIQSAVSTHMAGAARAEAASGRVRRMPQAMLFNTWLALLHHYVGNRDLFAPGASVLERHGSMLINHFLRLVRSH